MSLTGLMHTITITRTGPTGAPVIALTNFKTTTFTHEAGAVTASSATRDDAGDFVEAVNTYVVKIAYPNGSVPANTTTLANLITAASTAVTTVFGAGELT